jgi:hypothetical protein
MQKECGGETLSYGRILMKKDEEDVDVNHAGLAARSLTAPAFKVCGRTALQYSTH